MYGIEVTFGRMASLTFMYIYQIVQTLLVGDTQTQLKRFPRNGLRTSIKFS
jgi:hypothetical protein